MCSDAGPAPQPDANIGLSAQKMADLADRQQTYTELQGAKNDARLDELQPVLEELFRSQTGVSNQSRDIATANQQRLQSTVWPIERTLMADSLGYYDADPEMSAAIESSMRNGARNTYGLDGRMAALDRERAAYDTANANYTDRAGAILVDPEAIRRELAGNYTTARAWQPGTAATRANTGNPFQADYQAGGGVRGSDGSWSGGGVDTAGLEKAVAARVAQLEQQKAGIARPTSRDFAGEKAALQRDFDTYNTGISDEISMMRLYRDADLQAQESAARDAGAAVTSQGARARQAAAIELARAGVGPDSGKFAAMSTTGASAEAAAGAAAMTQARQAAKQLGWAKRMDTAGLGKGMSSNQTTAAGLALNGYTGATNSALTPGNVAAQNQGLYTAGLNGAGSLAGGSGQLSLGSYNAQVGAWSAATQAAAAEAAGWGSALGAAAGGYAAFKKK